ncbi:MAG: DUF362 domain-containing protein [Bacteroidetes bacterium]|nr:DUF362 domain-containing protein [Bacteroidota bacterium]
MKRRDLLKAGLLAAAAIPALPLRSMLAGPAITHAPGLLSHALAPDPMLAVMKGADIAATVRASVDALGGMQRFVKSGDVVFLKPNMSFPNPPEWGSTTHPEVIRAVVKMCAEAGAKRIIAADFPMRRAASCFERSGMTALAAELPELTFVELGEEKHFDLVPAPDAVEFKEVAVAKLLRKADVFINLPSAKAHSGTTVSFGLKNLMGVIQNRRTFHEDFDLHGAVADLAGIVRPHLTILDAAYALLTNGPGGPGRMEQLDTIIAGTDPLAVDAAGIGLAEWSNRTLKPSDVRHLALAAERGVGSFTVPEEQIIRKTLG